MTTVTRVPRWASDSLHRLPHGTGRISSVEPEDGGTILGLEFPDHATVELRVDALPDRRLAGEDLGGGEHALAVLVTTATRSELGFSVLASTRQGPTRVAVTPETALWLLRSGRHGVVRCGTPAAAVGVGGGHG